MKERTKTFRLITTYPSIDGATKLLWQLRDGAVVDSVFLEHEKMFCICLPTQVGCGLKCVFCQTGESGFVRNLDADEMVSLALRTREVIRSNRKLEIDRVLYNRAGEPLCNYANLLKSMRLLRECKEFKTTDLLVSTAGWTPRIYSLAQDSLETELWVSLNAPTTTLRSKLMPINRHFNLRRLLASCSYYSKRGGKLRLNYVLMESINDSENCAKRLAKIVKGKPFRLQIAQMNEYSSYKSPSEERILSFLALLEHEGIQPEYFQSKGVTIGAGCGQAQVLKPLIHEVIQ